MKIRNLFVKYFINKRLQIIKNFKINSTSLPIHKFVCNFTYFSKNVCKINLKITNPSYIHKVDKSV